VAPRAGLDDVEKKISLHNVGACSGPHNGYRGLISSGVQRHGCEAGVSLSSVAGIENGGVIPPLRHTSSLRGALLSM
jgi:hypothetical protein